MVGEFAHREQTDLAREGLRIAAARGCLRCHSLDGTTATAPSFVRAIPALASTKPANCCDIL